MGVKHIRADQISTEDGLVISGNVNLINGTFFTDGARFTGDWVKDENENVSREGKVGVSKDTVDNSENSANLQVSGDIDFTGDLYNNGVLFTAILGSSPWANLVNESNIYFTAGDVSIGSITGNAKLNVEGNVYASSNLEVGSANLFVDTETSRIGVNTRSPAATLHVEGNVYASSNLEVEGNVYASSNLEVEGNVHVSSNLTTNGSVGIGGAASAEALTVHGDLNLKSGGQLKLNGQTAVLSNWTSHSQGIYRSTNVGIGGVPSATHKLKVHGTVEMNGNIGINTSSPLAKLHVNGSKTSYLATNTTVGLLAWDESTYNATSAYWDADQNLSIYATDEIATNGRFFSTSGAWSASDARIKRDIEDINDSEALIQLRQLHPKKYGYKDVGKRGTGKVIGFIADEVEEVIPEAITKAEWGIPSILEVSNVIGSNVISFTNFSTSNLDSNAASLECLDVFGEEHFITIAKVIDEKTIQVDEDLSNWTGSFDETGNLVVNTTTAKLTLEEYDALEPDEQNGYVDEGDVYVKTITSYPGNNLFIRGERVNDFRTLKKEMLFAINFSATQELDRQLQVEKTRNDALEARILALEQKI